MLEPTVYTLVWCGILIAVLLIAAVSVGSRIVIQNYFEAKRAHLRSLVSGDERKEKE